MFTDTDCLPGLFLGSFKDAGNCHVTFMIHTLVEWKTLELIKLQNPLRTHTLQWSSNSIMQGSAEEDTSLWQWRKSLLFNRPRWFFTVFTKAQTWFASLDKLMQPVPSYRMSLNIYFNIERFSLSGSSLQFFRLNLYAFLNS